MKNLKFRVWHKGHKKWLDQRYIAIDCSGNVYHISDSKDEIIYDFQNHEYEIQMFTGLKDKKENDIYEGDILNRGDDFVEIILSVYDDNEGYTTEKHYGWVEKKQKSFEFKATLPDLIDIGYLVSGNIFENPDKLKTLIQNN